MQTEPRTDTQKSAQVTRAVQFLLHKVLCTPRKRVELLNLQTDIPQKHELRDAAHRKHGGKWINIIPREFLHRSGKHALAPDAPKCQGLFLCKTGSPIAERQKNLCEQNHITL